MVWSKSYFKILRIATKQIEIKYVTENKGIFKNRKASKKKVKKSR